MIRREKILIAGFSGAGKSSFMRELEGTAPESGWRFDDLDTLVVKRHKLDIPAIIETHGWEKFRLWERQELESWLKEEEKGVLSLGGGALSQLVLDLYSRSPIIQFVYLQAPFEDCWNRLTGHGEELRPLVRLGKGELHRIYKDREKVFSQISFRLENREGCDLRELAQSFWSRMSST